MWIYKVDPNRENEYGESRSAGELGLLPTLLITEYSVFHLRIGQKLSKEEAKKLLQQQNKDKVAAGKEPGKENKKAGQEDKKAGAAETKKNK